MVERLVSLDNMVMTVALGTSFLEQRPNFTETFVRFADLNSTATEFFPGGALLDACNRVLNSTLSEEDELVVTQGPHLRLLGRLLWAERESETLRGYAALMLARSLSIDASIAMSRTQVNDDGLAVSAPHLWVR
ncbi:hypothetical protein HPB48_019216 [Haemaphysalis longicornis]|uniref:Uncharacterized protein n=1 Tax=Haemaphysalis longicornis TaxID=44386 RepID=A0A9J6GAL0_HAELO|nr:hypothetical protein HPB48_019216 [Haemaphysalis longicornis]